MRYVLIVMAVAALFLCARAYIDKLSGIDPRE